MQTAVKILICIPTYNPDARLDEVLEELSGVHSSVLIYDDGSVPPVTRPGVAVERAAANAGKGAGIKAALVLAHRHSQIEGVLFCDSDGQHAPKDVLHIHGLATENPKQVIFGVRDFEKTVHVPFRNGLGNGFMRKIFRLLFRSELRDTQTGLRYIPRALFGELAKLQSSRFDYEMRQLCYLVKNRIAIRQVPIDTLYFEGNPSTFRSVRDSYRVLKALFGEFLRS